MSIDDQALSDVAQAIEKALTDFYKALREAGGESAAKTWTPFEKIEWPADHQVAVLPTIGCVKNVLQELCPNGSLAFQRSELPHASIGDEVIMWLKAETPLGGRHARMECVEMTSDTLTFREVGE